jgi:hypothetical protein
MDELTRIRANLAQGDAEAAEPLLSLSSEKLHNAAAAARSAASAGPSTGVTASESIKAGSSDV